MTISADLKRNTSLEPLPQHYNTTLTTPDFEVTTGENGALNTNVKTSALPTGAATSALQTTLNSKDFATQTTLAAILAKLIASPATESTLASIKDTSGIKKITDALPVGANIIGKCGIDQTAGQNVVILGAGTSNIGDVDVLTLPSLAAGTNNIGDVDVLTLPSIPAGTALIGKVSIDQVTDGTTNRVVSKISQTAGENVVICGSSTNNIGDVDVLTLPALVAGTALIGKVGIDQTTDATTNRVVAKISTVANENIVAVGQMNKGTVTTAHNAIVVTTTSTEINCTGYNSLLVECAVSAITSGNWVVDVQGAMVTGGTVGDCYDLNVATPTKLTTGTISADGNRIFLFRGIPDFVKILATRTTDGTLTCKVQPMNM